MSIQGNMVNGKFVDIHGMVHKFIPPDAEILNSTDGSDTKDHKDTTPHNGNKPGKTDNQPQQQTAPPSPPQTPPTPPSAEQPQPPAATPQTPNPTAYPKCISFEILRAVQTPSMVQVSIRAHCKGQFADAVVHYDFEVYEQAPGTEIISFKQTAMKVAHAEAVEIARKLLCEQDNKKPEE